MLRYVVNRSPDSLTECHVAAARRLLSTKQRTRQYALNGTAPSTVFASANTPCNEPSRRSSLDSMHSSPERENAFFYAYERPIFSSLRSDKMALSRVWEALPWIISSSDGELPTRSCNCTATVFFRNPARNMTVRAVDINP